MEDDQIEKIINRTNAVLAFAGKNDDFYALQNRVLESENPQLICEFAQKIKEADVEALQKAIEKLGYLKYMYQFAKNVDKADIEHMCRVVAQNKYPTLEYLTDFAELPGADKYALTKAVTKLNSLDNMRTFSRVLDKKGDEESWNLLCSEFRSLAIYEKDAAAAFNFGKVIPFAYNRFLIQVFIALKDPYYLYEVSKIKGVEYLANLQEIQDAMIATENFEYIEKFAETIEWADKTYIYKKVAKLFKDKCEALENN